MTGDWSSYEVDWMETYECESRKEEIEGNDNGKGPKRCQTCHLGLGQCFFIPL